MFIFTVLLVGIGIGGILLVRAFRRMEEALNALLAEHDASVAFTEWRLRNPGVYIGLSPEGRVLVCRLLEAYDWYMRTHTFIPEEGRREWILSLLQDLPPKSPQRRPFTDAF